MMVGKVVICFPVLLISEGSATLGEVLLPSENIRGPSSLAKTVKCEL